MLWIKVFITDFWINFTSLLPIFLVFFLITIVGARIFKLFVKQRNFLETVSAGFIVGIAYFIFLLGIFSYLFKAEEGIFIIFAFFVASGLFLALYESDGLTRNNSKMQNLGWKSLVNKNFFVQLLFFLFSGFIIAVFTGNAVYGGDISSYWNIASSFANGNYPLYSPWQPQYLLNYHQGAFLVEGAVYALTDIDLKLIHAVFSALTLWSGFCLIYAFMVERYNRVFLALIPGLFGLIVFGGIYIVLPAFLFSSADVQDLYLPTLTTAKNTLGGMTHFPEYFYIISRTVAIQMTILYFILVISEFSVGFKFKLILLSIFAAIILAVDETIFAAVILPTIFWIFMLFKNSNQKKQIIVSTIIAGIVFLTLFFLIGNTVRDSLLTSSADIPRFRVLTFEQISQFDKFFIFNQVSVKSALTPGWVWYMPDLNVIILSLILLCFLYGSLLARLFCIAALWIAIVYIFIQQTYYPTSEVRLIHQTYQWGGFAFGIIVLDLLQKTQKISWRVILATGIIILFIPSLISNFLEIKRLLPAEKYTNLYPNKVFLPVLEWYKNNVGYDRRLLAMDGFLINDNGSQFVSEGMMRYGLFFPTAPAKFKVNISEWGPEAADVIQTLSPKGMESLHLDYIYVQKNQIKNLSQERIKDLQNPLYFKLVYQDGSGTLYRVLPEFYYLAQEDPRSLISLVKIIDPGSTVYIDSPPKLNGYLASNAILQISDKAVVYKAKKQYIFGYIEKDIKTLNPDNTLQYDYMVLGDQTSPDQLCKCINYQKIWSGFGIQAFKKI